MRFQILLYVAAVKAFGLPNVFGRGDSEPMTCENPVTYTCIEYPYVVTTWASPTKTQYLVDPNNNDITHTVTVTETPQAIVTTLTSTETKTETTTETYSRNHTRTRTISKHLSTTVTVAGEPSAPVGPMTTPVMQSTMAQPSVPMATNTMSTVTTCTPPATDSASLPASTLIEVGDPYYLRLYTESVTNAGYTPSGYSLTSLGGITGVDSEAVQVLLGKNVGDGVLFSQNTGNGYGWFTADIPAVNKLFAISAYDQNSGKTARTFSFQGSLAKRTAAPMPMALLWDNCGFYEGSASFVYDSAEYNVYVIFDGVTNLGANRQKAYLVAEKAPTS